MFMQTMDTLNLYISYVSYQHFLSNMVLVACMTGLCHLEVEEMVDSEDGEWCET